MFPTKMLTAGDLMTSDPDFVSPDANIKDAIILMNRGQERHLPVMKNSRLVGIITDRDIRLAVNSPIVDITPLERLGFMEDVSVNQCMTANPQTVDVNTPLYKVAQQFKQYKFGALPVMENNEMVGIITVTDLLEHLALEPEKL